MAVVLRHLDPYLMQDLVLLKVNMEIDSHSS